MFPKHHFILGLIFSTILLILFPQIELLGFFVILLSSVLIDVDHYLYYVYRKKDFNLRNAINWFLENGKKYHTLSESKKKQVHFGICFLHGIEFVLLLLIFYYLSKNPLFLFISLGFIFHQVLDAIDLYKKKINPCKVLSLIYSLIYAKNKNLPEDIK